ncbi:MAG: hypothetical protein SFV81_27005, partial [Pirellulaceae bacterium]|nr:hypothetical protein [Pirellulaceae bacterium]
FVAWDRLSRALYEFTVRLEARDKWSHPTLPRFNFRVQVQSCNKTIVPQGFTLTWNREQMNRDSFGDQEGEEEGLDLTSEPTCKQEKTPTPNSNSINKPSGLTHIQVHFRCCKVYWRFPIPADVLSGAKDSWFVYCPRCGSQLRLP